MLKGEINFAFNNIWNDIKELLIFATAGGVCSVLEGVLVWEGIEWVKKVSKKDGGRKRGARALMIWWEAKSKTFLIKNKFN